MKISHLSLGVADLEVTERFYRDLLGLPVERVDDRLMVRWPDFLLVMTLKPPAERSKFHFGFRVDAKGDVDLWAHRLRTAGVTISGGPAENGAGTRQLFFLDPNEYEIEIFAE